MRLTFQRRGRVGTAARHRAASLAACAALVSSSAWGQVAVSLRLSATAETHATGVFLNQAGDVLTARHAIGHCQDILVVKDGRAAQARLRAVSNERDLAVLGTDLAPYLSATFPEQPQTATGSVGVFAEAYSVLQRMPQRASVLSNALTVPGGEGLNLISGVKPGTSGSAVLRGDGVSFSQSDLPQLAPNQSPAARAATLAVGILCG